MPAAGEQVLAIIYTCIAHDAICCVWSQYNAEGMCVLYTYGSTTYQPLIEPAWTVRMQRPTRSAYVVFQCIWAIRAFARRTHCVGGSRDAPRRRAILLVCCADFVFAHTHPSTYIIMYVNYGRGLRKKNNNGRCGARFRRATTTT